MGIIRYWQGRTGNNILQVGNALVNAYKSRSVFLCPDHPLFKSFSISFGYSHPISGVFFEPNLDLIENYQRFIEIRSNLINEFLIPKLILPKIKSNFLNLIEEGCLVAHARGGDIFDTNPPKNYVQHPLDYYYKLAKLTDKVLLIYEDTKNPIIQYLAKDSRFLMFSNDPLTDFTIFTKAKAVALGGVGTFVPAALLLNTYCNTIYYSNIAPFDYYLPENKFLNKICINMFNYISDDGWDYSSSQQFLMLNYKIS